MIFEVDGRTVFAATGGQPALFAAHTDHMNCVFCDGHVKAMLPTQTVSDPSLPAASQFNMWGGTASSTNHGSDPLTNSNPPGVCPDVTINCDLSEPSIFQGMQLLEKHYQ